MKMPISRCKLSKKVQKQLLQFFVNEVTARRASDLLGINRCTATLYYRKIREIIYDHLKQEAEEYFEGEVELDESYFGGRRKGKRGRGAVGKVYTKVIEDTKTNPLMPIIKRKIVLDSVVYTDCYRSLLQHAGCAGFHHHRIKHTSHFAEGQSNHINGIDNFWNQVKRVLRKYNGVPKKSFPFFLKECEIRFNYAPSNEQFKTLIKWCNMPSHLTKVRLRASLQHHGDRLRCRYFGFF